MKPTQLGMLSYPSRPGPASWIATARLLRRFQQGPIAHPHNLSEHQCADILVDRYMPSGPVLGTVVFIHGMSVLGREDPRVRQLAVALTAAGLQVLVPELPNIRNLRIERAQPSEVQSTLEQLAGDKDLVPTHHFALMAVSFSGVFALRATNSATLGPRISALCLIGGYYDVERVSDFLVNAKRADPYGRMLMVRSYFSEVEAENDAFHWHLERCLRNNAEEDEGWNLRSLLDEADAEQERLWQLLSDCGQRQRFLQKVIRAFGDDWSGYRVNLNFVNSKTPVFLLHGRGDRVIPPGESRRLSSQMSAQGIPNYLCITRFLSHGDSAIRLSQLPELYRLLRGFAWFISCIRR